MKRLSLLLALTVIAILSIARPAGAAPSCELPEPVLRQTDAVSQSGVPARVLWVTWDAGHCPAAERVHMELGAGAGLWIDGFEQSWTASGDKHGFWVPAGDIPTGGTWVGATVTFLDGDGDPLVTSKTESWLTR